MNFTINTKLAYNVSYNLHTKIYPYRGLFTTQYPILIKPSSIYLLTYQTTSHQLNCLDIAQLAQ